MATLGQVLTGGKSCVSPRLSHCSQRAAASISLRPAGHTRWRPASGQCMLQAVPAVPAAAAAELAAEQLAAPARAQLVPSAMPKGLPLLAGLAVMLGGSAIFGLVLSRKLASNLRFLSEVELKHEALPAAERDSPENVFTLLDAQYGCFVVPGTILLIAGCVLLEWAAYSLLGPAAKAAPAWAWLAQAGNAAGLFYSVLIGWLFGKYVELVLAERKAVAARGARGATS